MTSRIGLLTALLCIGLCGACGSSPVPSVETDADVTGPSSDAGTATTGGTGGSGGLGGTNGPGTVATGGNVGGGGAGAGGSESPSSDPAGKIASGTVAMNKTAGASTTSCQQVLRLTNPSQSLVGYLQMGPSAYLNDPRAGKPSYLYLDGGKDALILPGFPVTYEAASVDVSAAKLTTCVGQASGCPEGYRVQVNERLSYQIKISDWEEEIALGQVDLCLNNGTLTTEFVFAGLGVYLGGGVAHDVTITPILDGVSGTPTAPVTIECRAE
jgi:hypothetical protein